jgi:hypothetical protein
VSSTSSFAPDRPAQPIEPMDALHVGEPNLDLLLLLVGTEAFKDT